MSESLLHQIQNEAVDGTSDLATLLRKCRILAQRLNNNDLKVWVVNELDGYPEPEEVPDYRMFKYGNITADYFGPFGSELRNVPVPYSSVDEDVRDKIFSKPFNSGVTDLAAQIGSVSDSFLHIRVPNEAFPFIKQSNVAPQYVIGCATFYVPTAFLQGILDTVRNRILNFTLELESSASEAGDPIADLKNNKPQTVQHIFNTEIKGNVANFAAGNTNVTQTYEVPKGDLAGLAAALKDIGLKPQAVEEFLEAVKEEEKAAPDKFGKRVSAAIGKAMGQAYEGLLKAPGAVAGNLITGILKSYYGI
jgi:hypothetical protein